MTKDFTRVVPLPLAIAALIPPVWALSRATAQVQMTREIERSRREMADVVVATGQELLIELRNRPDSTAEQRHRIDEMRRLLLRSAGRT
jgi:hypothetical protein